MKNFTCPVCSRKVKLRMKGLFDDRYGAQGYYSVYQCSECGFGRTNPVLKKENIGEFYKRHYPLSVLSADVVKKSAKVRPKIVAWLLGVDNVAHRHIKKDSDVLDIGSGSGESLLEIKIMGARAYGIEPDPNSQKIAKKLKLNVHNGFITDNFFIGKKFDFITASQVFEHEPEPLIFLQSAKKKLKKEGQIILSVPNFNSLYLKIFGRRWINWHVPYHINFFNSLSFKKLAKKTGLRIIRVRTITPNVWTLMQVRSLLTTVKNGQKNPIWINATPKKHVKNKDRSFNLINVVFQIATIVFHISITPINRIIDLLGIGDSLFIILENEK